MTLCRFFLVMDDLPRSRSALLNPGTHGFHILPIYTQNVQALQLALQQSEQEKAELQKQLDDTTHRLAQKMAEKAELQTGSISSHVKVRACTHQCRRVICLSSKIMQGASQYICFNCRHDSNQNSHVCAISKKECQSL